MKNEIIRYVDVGAGLSISKELKKYKNKIDYVGFEPFNPKERMPNLPNFHSTTIYPYAVSNICSTNQKFYVTNKSACSSLKKPNFSKIPKSLNDKFEINKEILIETRTIDSYNFDFIDVLKVDAQGCGYEVLEGAIHSLNKISVIIVELEFLELYNDQKLSHETHKFLSSNGFYIYKEFIE